MAILPGWEKLSKNRYLTPPDAAGNRENVSYYAYLSAQARQSGFANYSEAARFRREHKDAIEHFREVAGPANRERWHLGGDLIRGMRLGVYPTTGTQNTRAGGELALFLERIGRRPTGATWPVGETNKYV